jgi:hypothetical protein
VPQNSRLATNRPPCQYYAAFVINAEIGGTVRVTSTRLAAVLAGAAPRAGRAQVLTVRDISLQLARTIADASIASCTADRFSVTIAAVDRAGNVKLLLRPDISNPHNADFGLSGAPDQAADEKCARAGLAAAASSLN